MDEQMPSDAHVQKHESHRAPHFALGARGEALAIQHLEQRGYRIVAANFSLPIGRNTRDAIVNAEIDVVAYDGATLCFIEVKTRASDEDRHAGNERRSAQTAADCARRSRLSTHVRLMDYALRYDVVSVVGKPDDTRPRIELHKAFWTDEQLRKKTWREPSGIS
jgi:putative endonuclease